MVVGLKSKVRSFVYVSTIERGIVRMRVVFVPRSVEIQPLFFELAGDRPLNVEW